MNYFEHHIGDYLRDTAHLSLLEHGVYRRLIDVYYTRESAIPEKEVARLIAARSKDEREALAAVLAEFFVLIDGAYTQKRCEEELHVYRESQEGAEDKKVNDKERQRRARERRKALFEQLRSHGVVPPWDTKTVDLQTLLSRVTNTDQSEPVTPPVTRDNTATQTPDTKPNTSAPSGASVARSPRGSRLASDWNPDDSTPEFAESLGLPIGAVVAELAKFRDFWAAKAGKDGLKLDWQATWRNWLRSAAERMPRTPAGQQPAESFRERDERIASERMAAATGGILGRRPQQQQPLEEVFDVSPRRIA